MFAIDQRVFFLLVSGLTTWVAVMATSATELTQIARPAPVERRKGEDAAG
jgi:hypothetical protein